MVTNNTQPREQAAIDLVTLPRTVLDSTLDALRKAQMFKVSTALSNAASPVAAPEAPAPPALDAMRQWDSLPDAKMPTAGTTASASTICAEMRALCSNCGGTGEVHRVDGSYVGTCDCMFQTIESPTSTPTTAVEVDKAELMHLFDCYGNARYNRLSNASELRERFIAALTQQSAAHAVKIKCVKCEGRGKHAEWSSAGAVVNVACACCGGNGLAAQAAHAGAAEKPLAHGHREDYYLMANARILAEKPIHAVRTMPNWVLASELFATGSNSAHQICGDAGIDPDGYKVVRAALAATEKKEQK